MDFFNNANTIASLVMALIGICGSAYGAVSYLRKKASRVPHDAQDVSQQASVSSKQPSIQLQKFTWLEWTEFLGQGLLDTANFILHICVNSVEIDEDTTIIGRLGVASLICGIGGGLAVIIVGIIISGVFAGLGIQDRTGAAFVIAFILLLALLSFIYLYHVGRRIELKRKEQYQALRQRMHAQQSIRR